MPPKVQILTHIPTLKSSKLDSLRIELHPMATPKNEAKTWQHLCCMHDTVMICKHDVITKEHNIQKNFFSLHTRKSSNIYTYTLKSNKLDQYTVFVIYIY